MPLACVSLRYAHQKPAMKRKQLRVCIWTLAALFAVFGPCWLIFFTTVARPVGLEMKEHAPHVIWYRRYPGPVTIRKDALKRDIPDSMNPSFGRFPIDGWSKEQVAACFGTPTRQFNENGDLGNFFLAPRFDSYWGLDDYNTEPRSVTRIWFRNDKVIYALDTSKGN